MNLPDESTVYQIASRAVSLRFCLELWAQGKQIQDLHNSLNAYVVEHSESFVGDKRSFKIIVETFCKHFSQCEKVDKIEVSRYIFTIDFKVILVIYLVYSN